MYRRGRRRRSSRMHHIVRRRRMHVMWMIAICLSLWWRRYMIHHVGLWARHGVHDRVMRVRERVDCGRRVVAVVVLILRCLVVVPMVRVVTLWPWPHGWGGGWMRRMGEVGCVVDRPCCLIGYWRWCTCKKRNNWVKSSKTVKWVMSWMYCKIFHFSLRETFSNSIILQTNKTYMWLYFDNDQFLLQWLIDQNLITECLHGLWTHALTHKIIRCFRVHRICLKWIRHQTLQYQRLFIHIRTINVKLTIPATCTHTISAFKQWVPWHTLSIFWRTKWVNGTGHFALLVLSLQWAYSVFPCPCFFFKSARVISLSQALSTTLRIYPSLPC